MMKMKKIILTYTVTACPPNVYSILVAPVKYNTNFFGPVCVTFSACNIISKIISLEYLIKISNLIRF